jgi:GH18 family chitinase
MRVKNAIVSTIIIISVHLLWAGNVIGYFTNWGIYGDRPYNPENVPFEKLTHIQYAFLNPQINGDIASFDSDAGEKILFGKMM